MAGENCAQSALLSPELKDALAGKFRALSTLAANTPDPAFWLARLEEIASWLDCPEGMPERFVDLLVTSKRSSLDLFDEVIAAAEARRVSLSQRLYMLVDELVCRSSEVLIALGPSARQVLLHAYAAAAPGSRERRWLLITLSRTGDPEFAPFFAALKENDFDPEGMRDPLRSLRMEFEMRRAVRAFQTGGEAAIYAALQNANEWWRWQAASALTKIGDERAIQALRGLLGDPSEFVRNNARHGLDWLERRRREDRKDIH